MLYFSTQNIKQHIKNVPIIAIILSLIIGIVVSALLRPSIWVWAALFVGSLIVTLFFRSAIFMAVVAYGGFSYSFYTAGRLPYDQPLNVVLKVGGQIGDYGSYSTWNAKVKECQGRRCEAKVRLTVDSLVMVEQGDVIVATTKVRPIDSSQSAYNRFVALQGVVGRLYLNSYCVEQVLPARFSRLHSSVVRRMSRLLGNSEASATALSIVLGAKSASLASTRSEYSYSGMSHMLAVSGLHIGLVSLLFSLFVRPWVFVIRYKANVVITAIILLFIWLYVAMCGYPPSALRAAVMFSVLNICYIFGWHYLNSSPVSIAALVMLAIDPTLLFDLSFMLSFVAVIAIAEVGSPLCRMLSVSNRWLRSLINSLVISTVCVAATLPIVSLCFGTVSALSIFITPVVLIFSQLTLIYGLAMVVTPDVIAKSFVEPILWCNDVGNSIVEWSVGATFGFGQLNIGFVGCIVYYVVAVLLLFLSWGIGREESILAKKD